MSFSPQVISGDINSNRVVEVTQQSDFGTIIEGSYIEVDQDITFIVRGTVTMSVNLIFQTAGGSSVIMGFDSQKDILSFTGTNKYIKAQAPVVIDQVPSIFTIQNIGIHNGEVGITDFCGPAYFEMGAKGRYNILNVDFKGSQRNPLDVLGGHTIVVEGCSFRYSNATLGHGGLIFTHTQNLKVTNCDFSRWLSESTITGTPPSLGGYAAADMLTLKDNDTATGSEGFRSVIINSNNFHPRETQGAIVIEAGCTIDKGTIVGNTFISEDLTTGEIFKANGLLPSTGAYASTEASNLVISGNSGLVDSGSAFQTLTDAANIAWDYSLGYNAEVTLTASRILDAPTNTIDGNCGTLVITQDAVGSHTLTLPASFKVVNGGAGAITLSTAASSIDSISWVKKGSDFLVTLGLNFN